MRSEGRVVVVVVVEKPWIKAEQVGSGERKDENANARQKPRSNPTIEGDGGGEDEAARPRQL